MVQVDYSKSSKIKIFSVNEIKEQWNWGIKTLGISEIWKETKGENIKILVLDTGSCELHPDLKGAIKRVRNFTDSPTNKDLDGHSTHVSGIIAARENGIGVVGIAPKCEIYIGKVLSDEGIGYNSWITNGIKWGIELGVDIINLSLGSKTDDSRLYAAVKEAYKKNIAIVCAAGNEGQINNINTINYPAKYEETISVGSISENMDRSYFSSVGAQLDIMAPGGKILSCYPEDKYVSLSGTSMATPFVVGIIALCLAKHRKLGGNSECHTVKEIKEHLIKTAIDTEKDGFDTLSGYGIINPISLLKDIHDECTGDSWLSPSRIYKWCRKIYISVIEWFKKAF